jgi:hypothetical protein
VYRLHSPDRSYDPISSRVILLTQFRHYMWCTGKSAVSRNFKSCVMSRMKLDTGSKAVC